MPTVDNLDIQISTSLQQSDKMLDNLIAKLGIVSSSLSSVGGKTSGVSSGMTKVATSTTKSTKSFNGLAAAFGKFYANYFWVVRGIKSLYNSIQGTADYIEAFNYFEVSFNKIASEWNQDYKKFGYKNAESYEESFSKRAKESLSKLSGVQIDIDADGKGILTETGMKNLGLNIQEITKYASQLASVTNSVGQTGEVSLATANSFTKLAGDISSLFNQDYSSVSKNLQSGLIGQSRALYKYGIDITNATLQTYAYNLGIEKNVSEMTQAEKMQLRMIAILDQSKVSWGDLANTINSPSNMIRQFKNNLKEAGMMLGQLFIPLLERVLPVLNGVTIAIKRLLGNIAGFLGIKLDLSSFGQSGADLGEEFDGISDSLDGVTDSADKAKKGLRGFDELKTINTGSSSDSGLGNTIDLTNEIIKATEEYEKVWLEAYDKMEQRAERFADAAEKYLAPVKKLFQDIAIGDWFAVGQDVSDIFSGIINSLTDAIENYDGKNLGQKIVDFICGIKWGDLAWDLIGLVDAFWVAYQETLFGIAIGVSDKFFEWIGIDTESEEYKKAKEKAEEAFDDFWEAWKFSNVLDNFFSSFKPDKTISRIKEYLGYFRKAFDEEDKNWIEKGELILKGIAAGLSVPFNFLIEPIEDAFEFVRKQFYETFGIDEKQLTAKKMKDVGKSIFLGIVEGFGNSFDEMKKKIKTFFSNLVTWWEQNKPNLSGIKLNIKTPKISVEWDTESFAAKALQKLGLKGFPDFSVKWYRTGGYLPNTFSLIGAGENGIPEILGSVGGRPAIAGGEEITGIRDEIRATTNEEIQLLKQQNALLQAILNKEFCITDSEIGKSAQRYAKDYFNRTGNEAYSF